METPVRYYQGCAVCVELWGEYYAATREHFRFEGQLQLARLSYDTITMQELLPRIQAAAQNRTDVRERIARHLAETHPVAGAVTNGR